MTALSFFSYKGGVGRTMALTNLAMRLVEFGKSVFIIDFDLEAPGVPYKLDNVWPDEIKTGLVDYIYEFSANGKIDALNKYVMPLRKNNAGDASMWLMPAGNTDMDDYWSKLSRINWYNLFYTEGGKGLRFFLDLKEKIRKEYNPDFILIDSRTGITELSGISLKILADEVVVLFVNNEENIDGTQKVLSFLFEEKKDAKEQLDKISLILTRVPQHHNKPEEFNKEYLLLSELKIRFAASLKDQQPEISVIHTDNRLQMNERLAFEKRKSGKNIPANINFEYSQLFEKIFREKFSNEEWNVYKNAIKAEEIYEEALQIKNLNQKIKLLTEAINLNDKKWEYYCLRGVMYGQIFDLAKQEQDFESWYNLSNEADALISWSISLYTMEKYESALEKLNLALEKQNPAWTHFQKDISVNLKSSILPKLGRMDEAISILNNALDEKPNSAVLYNARANLYRSKNNNEKAIIDAFMAIKLSPNTAINHGTLAEIYGNMGRDEEFYLTLNTALSKGLSIANLRDASDAYERFRHEQRFVELLRSYNMDSEDIFHNGPPKNVPVYDRSLDDDVVN